MLTILTAVHELRGREDPSDTLKEQPNYITPDLSTAGRESGTPDEEHKGEGTDAERPSEELVKHTSKDVHVGQDSRDNVQLGTPSGELWYPGRTQACNDTLQS